MEYEQEYEQFVEYKKNPNIFFRNYGYPNEERVALELIWHGIKIIYQGKDGKQWSQYCRRHRLIRNDKARESRWDIYLPDYGLVMETDGKQHSLIANAISDIDKTLLIQSKVHLGLTKNNQVPIIRAIAKRSLWLPHTLLHEARIIHGVKLTKLEYIYPYSDIPFSSECFRPHTSYCSFLVLYGNQMIHKDIELNLTNFPRWSQKIEFQEITEQCNTQRCILNLMAAAGDYITLERKQKQLH